MAQPNTRREIPAGKRVGSLVVVAELTRTDGSFYYPRRFRVKCDCGREAVRGMQMFHQGGDVTCTHLGHAVAPAPKVERDDNVEPIGCQLAPRVAAKPSQLLPRAHGRPHPVTQWRNELAALGDSLVAMIEQHEDPERRYSAAREVAEDIVEAVKAKLRREYGRTFDPLLDGVAG